MQWPAGSREKKKTTKNKAQNKQKPNQKKKKKAVRNEDSITFQQLPQLHFVPLYFVTSSLPSDPHCPESRAGEGPCAGSPAAAAGPGRWHPRAAGRQSALETPQNSCVRSGFASFFHPVISLFAPMQRSHLLCWAFPTIAGFCRCKSWLCQSTPIPFGD